MVGGWGGGWSRQCVVGCQSSEGRESVSCCTWQGDDERAQMQHASGRAVGAHAPQHRTLTMQSMQWVQWVQWVQRIDRERRHQDQ